MNSRRAFALIAAGAALGIGLVAVLATLYTDYGRPRFAAVDVTSVEWGRSFELFDHHGKRRTLDDFRGKVVLLFFGFTHCPDMCPTTLALLGEAMRELGTDAAQVQGLFVTVDPKRDTSEVLAHYLPAFHPSFLGLRGNEEITARTAKEFKIFFQAQPPDAQGAYSVDHCVHVFVFDRSGRLRLLMRPDSGLDSMVRDLRLLLKEGRT